MVAWSTNLPMQPWKRLKSWTHTTHSRKVHATAAASTHGRPRRKGRQEEEEEGSRHSGPRLFRVTCTVRHGTRIVFLRGLSTRPPSTVSFVFFLLFFTLCSPSPSPCLRVLILWDLLCAYCVLPNTSSSRQQFVVQQMACSFFPKMAAVKKQNRFIGSNCFLVCSSPPHSQSYAHSISPYQTGDNCQDAAPNCCSVHIHF